MKTAVAIHAPSFPVMIPPFAPDWAEIFGEDEFGVFAEFTLNGVRFAWRWIPPGQFLMGSPPARRGHFDIEGPQHDVTITHGLWAGETPVTQQQWKSLIDVDPSYFKGNDHPVDSVNWDQCMAFADWLNKQIQGLHASLPTEAQWEFACRAGTQGAFHVQDSKCAKPKGLDPVLDQLGWFDKNSHDGTHVVRLKSPNSLGLYDLHGNVWEWCRDGLRTYSDLPERDPVGTMLDSADRAVRGGCWNGDADQCRAAFRGWNHPNRGWNIFGFRLFAGQEPVLGAERPVL